MSEQENNSNKWFMIKTVILIGLVAVIILNFSDFIDIVKYLYGVISPLLLGVALAYILNILVNGYENIFFPRSRNKLLVRLRRGVCIFMSVFTVIVVLLFFMHIIIPQFSQSIGLLVAGFPHIYNNILFWLELYADEIPLLEQKLEQFNMDGITALQRVFTFLGNGAWGTVSIMGSVFGWVVNFILASVFAIYILISKDKLKYKFNNLLKAYLQADRRERLSEYLRAADESFSSFILGQFKEAVILGLLCTIGMLLFNFPYATIIGPVVGLTALIPMLGAFLGASVGFLLILIIDPVKALLFIVFIIVLQQIEGSLIFPKVVGSSMGLPGILIFAAVIVGAGLFGIAGILLGVPLTATIYKLVDIDVKKRLGQI